MDFVSGALVDLKNDQICFNRVKIQAVTALHCHEAFLTHLQFGYKNRTWFNF